MRAVFTNKGPVATDFMSGVILKAKINYNMINGKGFHDTVIRFPYTSEIFKIALLAGRFWTYPASSSDSGTKDAVLYGYIHCVLIAWATLGA
jgi:hypothetical protein